MTNYQLTIEEKCVNNSNSKINKLMQNHIENRPVPLIFKGKGIDVNKVFFSMP